MRAPTPCLSIICLLVSTGAPASGILTNVPILGPGWVLENFGVTTSAAGEIVAGQGSIKGAYFGAASYLPFLRTDPATVPLTPGQTYRVTFRYKILSTPDKGFDLAFFSPTGDGAGDWLPSARVNGAAGDTGSMTLTNTLKEYSDYRILWNVVGTGAIAIDDIQIDNLDAGQSVLQENAEQIVQTYVFDKVRTSYRLNLAEGGTDVVDKDDASHMLVPYGQRMSFAGAIKHSKNASQILHRIRAHAETYEPWETTVDQPVDFLRTGLMWDYGPGYTSGRGYSPLTSPFRFPDRPNKVVVGYVNSVEYGAVGGWDVSFDPAWDKNGDAIIDPGTAGLPDYVDPNVFNAPWKAYVAAYWTPSWLNEIKSKLDLVAAEHFDGVMLDVMTGYWSWLSVYPDMSKSTLRSQYRDFLKALSNYAKSTYGTAFMVTGNFDPAAKDWFPDLGQYVDAGYYQNFYFDWTGSGVVNGLGQSQASGYYSNPAVDYLKNQGLQVLDMDHLGTGTQDPLLNFVDYDDRITTANLLKLFDWAIQSGSLPFSTTITIREWYSMGFPRFVKMLQDAPPFTNTSLADWVLGSPGNDTIATGDGDDLIHGGPGNDIIDGGAGDNTANYVGASGNFTIGSLNGNVIVVDKTGAEGTDTLAHVQHLRFSDKTLAVTAPPPVTTANLRDAIYLYGQGLNARGDTVLVGVDCDVFQLVADVTSGFSHLAMGEAATLPEAIAGQTAYPDAIQATDAMFAYALYQDKPVKTFTFNDKNNPASSAAIGNATVFGYCYSTRPTAHVYLQRKDGCVNTYSDGRTTSCSVVDNGGAGTSNAQGMPLRDAIYLYGQPLNARGDKSLVGEGCDIFQLILDVNAGYADIAMGQADTAAGAYAARLAYPDRIVDTAAMFSYAMYDDRPVKTFVFNDRNAPSSGAQIGSATAFGYCYSTNPAARVYLREKDTCLDKYSNGQTGVIAGCQP